MGKGQAQIANTIRALRFNEQGRYSPSLEVAFRIADAFGAPLEEVFQWKGNDQ